MPLEEIVYFPILFIFQAFKDTRLRIKKRSKLECILKKRTKEREREREKG